MYSAFALNNSSSQIKMRTNSAGYCLRFVLQNPRYSLGIAFLINLGLFVVFLRNESAYNANSIVYTVQLTRSNADLEDQTNETEPLVLTHKGECWDYRRMSSMDRPKALDILGNTAFIEENERHKITLVTHLSDDRIDRLEAILKQWNGPVAATIHVDKSDMKQLLKTIAENKFLVSKPNIQLNIVQKEGDLYPVNYLRNTGLNATVTTFVFPVDVDLIPSHGAHDILLKYTQNMDKEILIVPAFQETSIEWNLKQAFPKSKDELVSLWDLKHVIPFLGGPKQCTKCHMPTNFPKWRNSTQIYWVAYRRYFEPYLVGRRKDLPVFSELFGGRFKDKISFVEEIYAMRHVFNVVPDVFLLHLWHEKSNQFNKLWSTCSNKAEAKFEKYLKEKYPEFTKIIWW